VLSSGENSLLSSILRTLRATLHACPEPAHHEQLTASVIRNFIGAYQPDQLITKLGGHGIAAVYEGAESGPTVLLRAELDALAICATEATDEPGFEGVAHRCGHDGHMAILAGMAPLLSAQRPERGRVVLLFQPAEETGEGAARVLEDNQFPSIAPDYAIGFHNVPGFPTGAVISRPGTFTSASVGMRVELIGIASHAAEPEQARCPSAAIAQILAALPELADLEADPYRLLTVTHVRMGRESYGITPGNATLCATLRSGTSDELEALCAETEEVVRRAALRDGLEVHVAWFDRFPETRNDPDLVELLAETCSAASIHSISADKPFRWSEDFGHFMRICPSLHFGLGIGVDAGRLHQPDYRFDDGVIETGLHVLASMSSKLILRG
jgi:amidohydrolase